MITASWRSYHAPSSDKNSRPVISAPSIRLILDLGPRANAETPGLRRAGARDADKTIYRFLFTNSIRTQSLRPIRA